MVRVRQFSSFNLSEGPMVSIEYLPLELFRSPILPYYIAFSLKKKKLLRVLKSSPQDLANFWANQTLTHK